MSAFATSHCRLAFPTFRTSAGFSVRALAIRQKASAHMAVWHISRSTFDLPKVLKTLLESAARLCEADKGAIFRPTGKDASFYVAASYRQTPEYDEYQKNLTFGPGRSGLIG